MEVYMKVLIFIINSICILANARGSEKQAHKRIRVASFSVVNKLSCFAAIKLHGNY